jgi:hypothetical protein
MDDERLFVVAQIKQEAKNTLVGLLDAGDVRVAPGRPEVIHYWQGIKGANAPKDVT